MRVAKETARLAAYAHAKQAVLEAGEVADGGGRPSTLAKGPAADVFASLRGVYWGMILGGDGLVCRLAVLRLLGTSLGWLAGGPRVDGRTPARADRVRFPRNSAAGGEREGRTLRTRCDEQR